MKALRLQAEKGQTDGDYLKFQLTQIQEAALLPDEQEELEKENALLEHAEEIKASLGSAAFAINGSDGERLAELRRARRRNRRSRRKRRRRYRRSCGKCR